jgi:L-ascorbate metabolism protein UlaG (beta-lactamase superfamily)
MHRSITIFLTILLLAGCGGHRHKQSETNLTGPRETSVEFLGHGCFRVGSSLGLSVLLDPFNPSVLSYPVKTGSVPADVVFITHEDETSNYADLASGSPQIFRSSMANGVNRASGLLVRGIQTSSETLSATSKLNVSYVWSMDGIRFCDLGAIEDAISPSEALNIGTVDVLFLPVGGPQNFTDEKRRITIDRLRPKIIVPMMYATSRSGKLPLRGLGDWLSRQRNVVRFNSNRFTLLKASLPLNTTVYVPSSR